MWTWIKKLFGKPSGAIPPRVSLNLLSESTTSSTTAKLTRVYDERKSSTPNKGSRPIKPEAVVLHHSSGSYAGTCNWIMNPASKVSYHVVIARDGRRTVFCNDTERAWHAGKSSWKGRGDLNSWSLGVSWEGDTYITPLGDAAMESAIQYLAPRMKKWGIPLNMVLTHQQVSPNRKTDISAADAARFKSRLKAALN